MTTWDDVVAAVTVSMGPEPERGLAMLDACWSATSEDDHAQRCVLAHYLADRQVGLDAEIAWDETALQEYAHVGDDELAAIGIPSASGLAPSLHLNLGDGYARRGDVAAARAQLASAQAAVDVLPDDGYGQMIRRGVDGLAERLGAP
jgi:hypothetical protein